MIPLLYLPQLALVPKLEEGMVAPLLPTQPTVTKFIVSDPKALSNTSSNIIPSSITMPTIPLREETKERRFACEKCCRRYVRKISLQRHQKYECGKEQHLACPIAGCQYKTFYHCSLKKHMLIHANR